MSGMRALAFEHLSSDPIGIFGDVLAERGISVDRVLLHESQSIPDWREYDLLVGMGAGVSVWQADKYPWIADEKRAVREAVVAGRPYFGVCFGVQLLADVFGGQGFRGREPELGVNQVFLTAAAQHDPVFRGFPADLEVCEWHSNHFSLPPGAVRLARSPRYENQAIRYGRVAYGIQSHLVTSLENLHVWLEDELPETAEIFEKRHGEGAVARLLDDYADFVPFLQDTGRQVFGRWLQNAFAYGGRSDSAPGRPAHGAPLISSGRAEPQSGLIGRDPELSSIDLAIASARRGESAVLVLRGEGGVGKSALLSAAKQRARGLTVVRAGAHHSGDGEQPFAALADLCRPFGDLRQALSPERTAAVASILGPELSTPVHDRFAVYAGAFGLLTAAAIQSPLLLLVDDAHLLDDASREAIAFIARRLGMDGISLVIATESEEQLAFAQDLRIGGLHPPDARALLDRRWARRLAPSVMDAIVAAAAGNPLALLEIPVDLSPQQRAGEVPIEGALPWSAEWAFLSRIASLPVAARQALLLVALAGEREQDVVPSACRALGLDPAALDVAQTSGLIRRAGAHFDFVHALARVVISYSAPRADRRAAHAALAEVTAGDSCVWHSARAAAHADESVAAGLELIARRARDRTAFAAAAAVLERAARLTPDRDLRARRLPEAAEAAHREGQVNAALDHVDAALRHVVSVRTRRAAEHLRGRVIARSGSARVARDQLVTAADRCEREDPAAAAEMLADAVLPTLRAGQSSEAVQVALRAEQLSSRAPRTVALSTQVALGMALIFAGDYGQGADRIDAAEQQVEQSAVPSQLVNVGAALELAGRHAAARAVLTAVIAEARAAGSISTIPYALIRLAEAHLETGDWTAASAALPEAHRLADETGQPADCGLALGALAWLAAARGDAEECHAFVHEALQIAQRLGSGSRLDRAGTTIGMLELGRGKSEDAIAVRTWSRHMRWRATGIRPERRSAASVLMPSTVSDPRL